MEFYEWGVLGDMVKLGFLFPSCFAINAHMKKIIVTILASIGVIFLLIVLSCAGLFWFGLKKAEHLVEENMVIAIPRFNSANLPPIVSDSMPKLIARLNATTKTSGKNGGSLQPGLTDAELDALGAKYAIQLSPEIRSLYRCCNGGNGDGPYFTYNKMMLPLEGTLQQRKTFKDGAADSSFLRALRPQAELMMLFTGPETMYYWDPRKTGTEGAFFSRTGLTGVYHVYPSLNNMIAAMVECQEAGIYDELTLRSPVLSQEAVGKEMAIHEKYSLKIQGKVPDLNK